MDGGMMDLEAVRHHVETGETLSFIFPLLRRCLVFDFRAGPEDGPLVRIMPITRSASSRLRALKRLRPNLPRPRNLVAIQWPVYVNSLKSTGVWDRLLARLADFGFQDSLNNADRAFAELKRMERHEIGALIRGDRYETIWARSR